MEGKKHRNRLAGLVGALLGALIGAVCTAEIHQPGYLVILSGLVAAACAIKGYGLLEDAVSRKKARAACVLAHIMDHFGSQPDFSGGMTRQAYEKELLEQQNQAYRAECGRLRQSEQQVRALRHDMKNHLAVLQAYAARGQLEELRRYLSSLDQQLTRPGLVHTGNLDIDSILNYKLGQAEQAGARLAVDVRLPADFAADPFDLNVILGNLLDNAVEGLKKSEVKELSLSLASDRGMLFLNIANSYDGVTLRTDGPGGPVYRSRKGSPGHGLGLSIVRHTVDKYHGELRIDDTGRVFSAKAVLYLER